MFIAIPIPDNVVLFLFKWKLCNILINPLIRVLQPVFSKTKDVCAQEVFFFLTH